MKMMSGKNKKLVVVVAMTAVVILTIMTIILLARPQMAKVNITVTPGISKVTIGDVEYSSFGEFDLEPGEYDVKVSAEGFMSRMGKLTVKSNETVEIMMYLEPIEDNRDWYETHASDGLLLGEIKSQLALRDSERLKVQYPILNYIPYILYTYKIDYETACVENGGGLCIVIDAEMGLRDAAIEYLQNTGVNLAEYRVKIKGYEEPFSQVAINVPVGLEYTEKDSGAVSSELDDVLVAIKEYLQESLTREGYTAEALQVKNYGKYCGVKLKVYREEDGGFDIYRMIVGEVGDGWRVLSNVAWILDKYENPLLPMELLEAVNRF